jgi:hypothetical protein
MSGEFNSDVWSAIKQNSTTRTNGFRGIEESTTKVYGVRQEFNEDGVLTKQYYPTTKKGQHVRS